MARYCGVDRHYADVECPYAELERYLVLSCNGYANYWKERGHHWWPIIRATLENAQAVALKLKSGDTEVEETR